MKKIIVLFLSLTFIVSGLFATSDYDQGYLDGYLASQNGKANEVDSNQSGLGVWELHSYIDGFGYEIEDGFISLYIARDGTFSNSAVTNEELYAFILIDEYNVTFRLLEYGTSVVKGNWKYPDEYSVSVKCDGKIYNFDATNYSSRLLLDNSDALTFIELLKSEKSLTIYIEEILDDSASSYLIKNIETTGFNNAYDKLINK